MLLDDRVVISSSNELICDVEVSSETDLRVVTFVLGVLFSISMLFRVTELLLECRVVTSSGSELICDGEVSIEPDFRVVMSLSCMLI